MAWVALSAAFPGAWATFATDSFHRSFPLGGPGWVAPLGPASSHLTADVGAFYLAFALLFSWATLRPSRELVLPTVGAWTLFSALHFGWHAANTAPFGTGDAVAQLVALGAVLVLPFLTVRLLPR
ncbi:MAG: hypothetical protein Q7T55_04625 [Solirubrobacteraceae bacterium]|nr:hypothetical protein [Solirubrobacteraceae bacterium]